MNRSIIYKGKEILFNNLLQSGQNIDKWIIEGTLFSRGDHKYELFYRHLKPGDVVWDIGAYIGTFSIPFSITGHKVYAFEGFPDNFNRLVENCKPYDIECHSCALSNENKIVESTFGDCQDQANPKRDKIHYVKFDEYVSKNNIPNPKFVKMDIEGNESLALLEMKNVLENDRPIWQIGYHHPGNTISDKEHPEFVKTEHGGFDFNTFERLDYIVFDLKNRGVQSKFKWGDCNGEYMCIPKEKIRRK
jgi:FkbM family methyltransferase